MRRETDRPAISQSELKRKENFCIQVLNALTDLAVQTSNCFPHLRLADYKKGWRSNTPHFHKRLEFPLLYRGWYLYVGSPGSLFLNGLVCRLLGFLAKRREMPEQLNCNVRLHRGKRY